MSDWWASLLISVLTNMRNLMIIKEQRGAKLAKGFFFHEQGFLVQLIYGCTDI